MSKWAPLIIALVAGCVDDDPATDVFDEETCNEAPLELARSSASGTPSPSSDYNFNGRHNDQCSRLEGATPLRYADGTPTGYVLDPAVLRFNPDRRPIDDSDGHRCRDGEIQLDTQEILPSPEGRLLFHRGGFPYQPAGDVKYGHVRIGDLRDHADVDKNQANGVACSASTNPATDGDYEIVPTSIPSAMSFRKSKYAACAAANPNALETCTNGFTSYGDPGRDQGSFPVRFSYTYLLWNFVSVPGGGVVRALLPPDHVFHRCNVRSIRITAYSPDGRRSIGWVTAVYGKTTFGGDWLYGWIVHSHYCRPSAPECAGQSGTVFHVRAR